MSSGFDLFVQAETAYAQGRNNETFELYRRSILKIIKDENPTGVSALMSRPGTIPAGEICCPRESLGLSWRNFVGFFKDSAMRKDKDSAPEAYKLLMMFRPKSTHNFARFRTDKAKIFLKGMQISAGFTLGLLAWDVGDRPAALKHYRYALDLVGEYKPYNDSTKAEVGWEMYIALEVKEMRQNLTLLLMNDEINVRLAADIFGETHQQRREVLGVGYIRHEADGTVKFERSYQVASDKCGKCGRRDAKMQKCSACKLVSYCDATCQKGHWPSHKAACKAARAPK